LTLGLGEALVERDPRDRERSFGGSAREFLAQYSPIGRTLDSSRKAIAGDAAASILFDPNGS
jgi:hypothetical protein